MAELLKSVMPDWRRGTLGKWPVAGLAALALTVGSGVIYHYTKKPGAPGSPGMPLSSTQLASQELCLEGALLYHDVRWAYVCTTLAERGQGDGHPECELPEAEATRLSTWLQQADQKCMAEASALR
jgi:hypothetical protein